MAGETVITVVGNLTSDPELRFTQGGLAVANFTIASTPRTLDRATNQWKDGEALFLRCSIWREYAEQVQQSLTKGARVIAQGRLKQRSYETKEGEKRISFELDVDEIGPSLRYAVATVSRTAKRDGSGGGAPQQGEWSQPASQGQSQGQPQQADPWNQPAAGQQSQQQEWGQPGTYNDETPF
jgi:single-strand DNA-binding protein